MIIPHPPKIFSNQPPKTKLSVALIRKMVTKLREHAFRPDLGGYYRYRWTVGTFFDERHSWLGGYKPVGGN